MPDASGAAKGTRFTIRGLATLFGLVLAGQSLQPPVTALAATIQSNLSVYQNGDTVQVTGSGFSSGETVRFVTTDPNGTVIDSGSAGVDGQGAVAYQFVLNASTPGIYTTSATGQTSGATATTQFDPKDGTALTLSFASPTTYGVPETMSGSLTDLVTGSPMPGVTISLSSYPGSQCSNSTLLGQTITDTHGRYSFRALPPAGSVFIQASYAGDSAHQRTDSACTPLTIVAAPTTTSASESAATITTSGSTIVSWTLSSTNGVTGNTATGTAGVVQTIAPAGGSLICSPSSASVSAAQTTGTGFTYAANPGANSTQQFTCSANALGTYTYHVHFTDADGNYAASDSASINLTVNSLLTTSTAVNRTAGSSPSTYGDSLTFTATVTGAVDPSGVGTVTFLDGPSAICSSVPLASGSNQASCTVSTLSAGGSPHSVSAQYSGATVGTTQYTASSSAAVSQTVNPKPLTGTFTAADKMYDGTTAATITGSFLGTGVLAGDSVSLDAALATASFADANAGAGKTVTSSGFRLAGSSATNYSLSMGTTTASINPAPLTIAADAKSKVYGDPDPALTYQLTSGHLVGADSLSGSLTRDPGETVGSYGIHQGGVAGGGNYTITFVAANLTIAPRGITVTADPQSKVYGTPDPGLTYRVTSGSLVSGDDFTGALTRVAGENVGIYAIQQGTLALSNNYALTYVGAELTITARPVTVTADPQSKVYGTPDPGLTYQVTSGSLVSGDGFTGALTRVAGENVGSYAIEQGTLALSGNYDLGFVGATLTITARPVTVTADAQSKVYGTPDPGLTYQVTSGSLVSGDGFTGALTRVAGENVGSYAIEQGTLALSANYDLTFVRATLTISRAPLTARADSKSMLLNGPLPPLTGTVTGAVNGDLIAASYWTSADGHTVGTFPIVPALQDPGGRLGNYDVTLISGTLSVRYAAAGTACAGAPGHAVLQPISADGSSTFKAGSTVPVKFRVCDANGNSIGASGPVVLAGADGHAAPLLYRIGTTTLDVNQTADSTVPDSDFRWDPTNSQWVFNLSTNTLPPGRHYYYYFFLNDGSQIGFDFGLK